MLKNAPYLARTLQFMVPCYRWLNVAYFDTDSRSMTGSPAPAASLPANFSRAKKRSSDAGIKAGGIVGSVAYADGQFDDARYDIALVQTFSHAGGSA